MASATEPEQTFLPGSDPTKDSANAANAANAQPATKPEEFPEETFPPGSDLTKDSANAAKARADAQVYIQENQKARAAKSEELKAAYEKEYTRCAALPEYERRYRYNDPQRYHTKCGCCGLFQESTNLSKLQNIKTGKWETMCRCCTHLYLYPQVVVAEWRRTFFMVKRADGSFDWVEKFSYDRFFS